MYTDILKMDTNQTDDIYNLLNTKNYKPHISDSLNEIINIFILLIKEYIILVFKKGIKNESIFLSGLNTLIHIFNITFYYTKNLKLTCYYTQQGYHVYLDFINELNNVNISFLNLKTKDAIMFVYKKTIFNICNDYRKNISYKKFNNNEDDKIFETLNKLQNIYKNVIEYFSKNIINTFIVEEEVNNFCNNLTNVNNLLFSKKRDDTSIDLLKHFIILLTSNKDYTKNFFTNIEYFLNNITKKKYFEDNIVRIKTNINNIRIDNCKEIDDSLIDIIISGSYEL
jgi:hypothetical protein